MEELSIENILLEDEFEDTYLEEVDNEDPSQEEEEENPSEEGDNNKKNNTDDEGEDPQESVVGDENSKVKEKPSSSEGDDSPKFFYSSIANALREDGVFPDLNDDTIKNIKNPEDFVKIVEDQIKAQLSERQNRIDSALKSGIEPTEISKYESTLEHLNSIDDTIISDESEKGEDLRKRLIFSDYINRGYSKERATREVKKSMDSGSDVEDAKEALLSNKEYFKSQYDALIEEADKEAKAIEKSRAEQAVALEKSILEDKVLFGDLEIDKTTRKKIFENISKPIYKDPASGNLLTALQKFQLENGNEFIKNIGILYTLTDGFKSMDNLVKTKVAKAVKQGVKELEHTINNTSRSADGSLKWINGPSEDKESYLGKGWEIDLSND